MIAAGLVLLTGFPLIDLGLVEHSMYEIGIVVVLIASFGIAVKLADWIAWLRD